MTAVPTTEEHAADPQPAATRPYARTRLAAGLIGRSWLWFITGCLLVTLVPMLFGWRPYVIESGSMQPRINIGDVVLAAPVAAADRQELLGRVTVFDSPAIPGKVITHRVVRFDGDRIVTKGDANQTVDSARITMSSVRGLGRLLVRWVGLPLVWLKTGQWLWLLLFLSSLMLAVVALVRDHEEEETAEDDSDSGAAGPPPVDAAPDRVGDRAPVPVVPRLRRRGVRALRGAGLRALRGEGRRRPVWLLRTILVLAGTMVLAVPSSFAAFAATTRDNSNVWTVPNYDYPTEVNNLGPYLYWRLEETGTATTAADSSGNGRTGTYNPNGNAANFTRLTTGALVTDTPDNAVALASASACINTTSNTAINAPTSMSEIIWFKTTAGYATGGKLIGFEKPRTGVAVAGTGTYDRHLYMDGNGKVWFGVYNGGFFTISSAASYNDGSWHMAAAVFGSTGMHLYVDGVQVASNANTVGEATTGWFRVGCGNLAGWGVGWTGPNAPPASTVAQNMPFTGSVDEATVFMSQLTAAQIAFLYWTR